MIKGFICEKGGGQVSFDECLKCALTRSRCNYTYQMLKGMSVLIRQPQDNVAHITELMPCLRRTYLDRFYDVYLRPRDMFVRFRGQLGHLVCERWKPEKGSIVEQMFIREVEPQKVNGIRITGRPDEVIPDRKLIRDYKTTRYVKNANLPYGNHPQQVLMYRVLVQPIEIDTIEVIYFDMSRSVRWTLRKGKDKNQERWDVEKVGGWMDEKAKELMAAIKTKTPPERELDKEHWLCKSYCEYRHICKEVE